MIHTTADFDLLSLVSFHSDAIESGINSLIKGCTIVTDTEMSRMGITSKRMDRLGCRVECYISASEVKEKASRNHITRASAAVGECKPSLIVGMPVGFVNAAESKELLINQDMIPFITIRGRKGGSALAASVINELAEMSLEKKNVKYG